MDKIIDTIGYTVKEDNLVNIKGKHVTNTLVLETTNPFVGYPKGLTADLSNGKPRTVFFVTKNLIAYPVIVDMVRHIQREFKTYFQATIGTIIIDGKTYNCITVYDLANYENIEDLQNLFIKRGVEFYSTTKEINNYGLINNYKQMLISEIDDGIYSDSIYPDRFYLELPDKIEYIKDYSYMFFNEITNIVKTLLLEIDFNAALSSIYVEGKITSSVRIFTNQEEKPLSVEDLVKIKQTYFVVADSEL
jgi:hypothetical protein